MNKRKIFLKKRLLSLGPEAFFYLTILLVFSLLFGLFALINPRFILVSNILNVLRQAAPTLIAAVGMTFVIATAGIDLSIGSLLAVLGILSAMLLISGLGTILTIIVVLIVGAGMGALNGFFVSYQRIPPFIVTLATLFIYRGIALLLTHGYAMPISSYNTFVFLGRGYFLGLPVPIWLALVITVIGYIILYYTRFGSYTLGVGSNEESVRRAGINVKRIKFWTYTTMGLLTAISSIIVTARLATASSYVGSGFELTVITAVILGGTSFFGGEARMLGTVVGTLMLAFISNGLIMVHVSAFYEQIAEGGILLFAIWLNQVAASWRSKR